MKRKQSIYTFFHHSVAVFLIAVLGWLTVSTPYIISTQQKASAAGKVINWCSSDCDDEGSDSSGNNIDEKAPSGPNLSEEFLHEHHSLHSFSAITDYNYAQHNADVYVAFHGELHAPPPNAA